MCIFKLFIINDAKYWWTFSLMTPFIVRTLYIIFRNKRSSSCDPVRIACIIIGYKHIESFICVSFIFQIRQAQKKFQDVDMPCRKHRVSSQFSILNCISCCRRLIPQSIFYRPKDATFQFLAIHLYPKFWGIFENRHYSMVE